MGCDIYILQIGESIDELFIDFVLVLRGKSERGERVEYIILLSGNLMEDSVAKAKFQKQNHLSDSLASDYLSLYG